MLTERREQTHSLNIQLSTRVLSLFFSYTELAHVSICHQFSIVKKINRKIRSENKGKLKRSSEKTTVKYRNVKRLIPLDVANVPKNTCVRWRSVLRGRLWNQKKCIVLPGTLKLKLTAKRGLWLKFSFIADRKMRRHNW